MKRRCVIAIDGPAASGKSTVARLLAQRLGFAYLDTGAIFRAITLKSVRESAADLGEFASSCEVCFEGARVLLDGEDVTDAIRDARVTDRCKAVADSPAVRAAVMQKEKAFAVSRDIVVEGRDTGTVVFPKADVKIYLDAAASVRADRRRRQLKIEQGIIAEFDQLYQKILARDETDIRREIAPLKTAADAIVVDTTGLDIEETVDVVERIVRRRLELSD